MAMSVDRIATPLSIVDSTVRIPSHVVHRTFALETVVVNLQRGLYHGLNPSAGRMLETLERTPNVREAAAKLAQEFDVPLGEIEADLCVFCCDLLERGLLEVRP
jgi:Coenzyme PQQ synthesis protein D (PqqD)